MQNALFNNKLKRLELLNTEKKSVNKEIIINVFRNHSFEMVENIIEPFLNYSHLKATFNYSDYDDSLNFGNIPKSDINLIWIDIARYKNIEIKNWLEEKADELANISKAPILLAYTSDYLINDIKPKTKDFYYFNVNQELDIDKDKVYDLIKEPFSGTRLSNTACIELSRVIAFKYIPAILKQNIKAVVFDMDNTLYSGIIGEDGIENVIITDIHKEIYNKMHELKQKGIMLCIASKNAETDVKEFFEKRKDINLNLEDFAAYEINWNQKSENILKIAQKLNIHPDSMLFIDDNPAEIQNVEASDIGIKTFLAQSEELTLNALKLFPGLFKLNTTKEDELRTKDIQANEQREVLVKQLSPKEYFEKLQIKLDFYVNNEEHFKRVSELLNKTNQFIFNYARLNITQVEKSAQNGVIITVNMSDKLSDSGIIAILAAQKENGIINLKELTVSCRALGRNLEEIMILKLFEIANKSLYADGKIKINYKKGPRNMPAISFLEKLTGKNLDNEGSILFNLPQFTDTKGLIINIFEEQKCL